MSHCAARAGRRLGPRGLAGCRLPLLGLVFLLATLAAQAAAQENAPSTSADTASDAPAVEAVATQDLAVRSERARQQLREAEAKLVPSDVLRETEEVLPEVAARYQTLQGRSEEVLDDHGPIPAIEELQMEWSLLGGSLSELQQGLTDRASVVDGELEGIRKQEEVWSATLADNSTEQTPEEVVAQIHTVLDAAKQVRAQGSDRQGAIVKLQSRVAQMTEGLRVEVEALEGLRRQLIGQVFERDKMPLWDPRGLELIAIDEMVTRVRGSFDKDVQLGAAYLLRVRERIALHVLAMVLLVVFVIVGRRSRDLSMLGAPESSLRVILSHPVSMAAMLVLMVSIWTFPQVPRPILQLRAVVLLAPAVVLLRRFLPVGARALLYWLMFFIWVIDRGRLLLTALPQMPRVLLVVELSAVVVLSIIWLRGGRIERTLGEHARPALQSGLRLMARILAFVSVVAIGAEIDGYHALASLLAEAIVFVPIGGIVLYGAVQALDGLVGFLMITRPLVLLRMVRRHRELLKRNVMRGAALLAVLWWLYVLLKRLEIYDDLWGFGLALLTTAGEVGGLSISLWDVLAFGVTIWLSFKASKLIAFALEEDIYPYYEVHKGRSSSFSKLSHYTIVTLGSVVAVLALGIDLDRITIMLGAFSVGIGFGLQSVVNNFVSGLILLTERPIEMGDTVALGEVFGEVQEINLRSSVVRTWQGAEVIVPNAQLIAEQVTNWTHSDRRRRMEIPVGVKYGTPTDLVMRLLMESAEQEERVLDDPPPFVLFMGFGESALEFELRAWTGDFDSFLSVRSSVALEVNRRFLEAGIEIPIPQRDVHVHDAESNRAGAFDAGTARASGPTTFRR